MSYVQYVKDTLSDRKSEDVNTPLNNTFILDGKWLVEMDCDGAFAATVSQLNAVGSYQETHVQIVFSGRCDELEGEMIKSDMQTQIDNAIATLKNRVA